MHPNAQYLRRTRFIDGFEPRDHIDKSGVYEEDL